MNKYQDMALVKHKLLMVKSCCTFKVPKQLNVPVKCCKNDIDLVYCAEKYTKMKMKKKNEKIPIVTICLVNLC